MRGDYLSLTRSFKDRGSAVMLSKLREWRGAEIAEDSSGNAVASVAAYAARDDHCQQRHRHGARGDRGPARN
jgi:threonine synthase